jgi:NADH-quinone oxidoreductase subunit G
MEPGTLVTGKAYAALHRLGFDAVFDTNFSADLTIMEEGSEFVQRFVHKKGELPLITSCCPAWVDFMEKYHEDMIPHFSTAKSPQEMMGVMTKTYYAEKIGKKPSEICMVSVMPCTAKKYELSRSDEMFASGAQDIDVSITTRELSRMIKQAGIDFETLPDDEADSPLGMYTGAGTIFGATGGVMEAALRSAYYLITGSDLEEVELSPVRGLEGVKEAAIDVQGTEVRVAIAHGMVNINTVLERVRQAKERGEETPYHFIEVMACRGGCVAGGGQPRATTDEVREQRINGLYADDTKSAFRCSHHNPAIKKLYEDYLEAPLSKKAHELLHASYTPRPIYQK